MTQDLQQRSEDWFTARRGRVTASSAGAILGYSPHATRADVMRRMVRAYHQAPQEFTGNIATQWGDFHEATARAEYEMQTGREVRACGFFMFSGWLGASPDGLVNNDGMVEFKCPFSLRKGGNFKSLREQMHYYAQVQVQLFVVGAQWCDFFQWAPHGTMLERVERDEAFLDEALPDLYAFWCEFRSELANEEHLMDKFEIIDTVAMRALVDQYVNVTTELQYLEERKKQLLADIVAGAKEKNAIVSGHKLTKVTREGSVKYAEVVKSQLPDLDLSPWRGKPSEYWVLK